MHNSHVPAQPNSAYDTFLFSAVGTDRNGSRLTVLSTLARLGDDPWKKAASLARMSPADAEVDLAARIAGMKLCPRDSEAKSATASRLIELLPSRNVVCREQHGTEKAQRNRAGPAVVAILVCIAAAALAARLALLSAPSALLQGLTAASSESLDRR